MRSICLIVVCLIFRPWNLAAQEPADPIKVAISQGDLFQSKHKYELAQDSYKRADKLSHHASPEAYLKLSAVDRKLGNFPSALDDAKKALKAAGDNKNWGSQAHLVHANLLVQMSSKSSDKRLKEAEADIRQAIALDPSQSIAHFNLGYVLLKQERDSEGIAELKTYISAPGPGQNHLTEAQRMIANPIRAREPFAPEFSFTSHEKQVVSNASLRGKVVLIDFWGTWCPPCRESVPTMRNLQKKYAGKGFQLVGVSSDDDEDVWRTFIEAQKMDWTEYMDFSGEVLRAFKIDSFPTYIVLDKDGVMRFRQSGFGETTEAELEDAIKKALKRPSDPNLAAIGAARVTPNETLRATASNVADKSENASPNADARPSDPKSSDTDASFSLSGIEAGVVSGNISKNEALNLSMNFLTAGNQPSPVHCTH